MQTSSREAVLDVKSVRSHFPALARVHAGLPVAYFDGPGGTQVPQTVVDAMSDYLLHHNANTHWRYPSSVETDAALDAARVVLAEFLNADATEIAPPSNRKSPAAGDLRLCALVMIMKKFRELLP